MKSGEKKKKKLFLIAARYPYLNWIALGNLDTFTLNLKRSMGDKENPGQSTWIIHEFLFIFGKLNFCIQHTFPHFCTNNYLTGYVSLVLDQGIQGKLCSVLYDSQMVLLFSRF